LHFNEPQSTQTAQAWGGVIFLALLVRKQSLLVQRRLISWALAIQTQDATHLKPLKKYEILNVPTARPSS